MVNKSINVYLFSDSRTAVKTQQINESIQMYNLIIYIELTKMYVQRRFKNYLNRL